MTNQPRTVSVNEAIDFAVDNAQNLKNFINSLLDKGVDFGQDAKNSLNETADRLIDELQKLKG